MAIYVKFLLNLLAGLSITAGGIAPSVPVNALNNALAAASITSDAAGIVFYSYTPTNIPDVPFYSQFYDISSPKWQKLGCGIAGLAMLIEFYKPGVVSVDALLDEGIAAGAFINGVGWTHRGLASLAQKYGLRGDSFDLSHLDMDSALAQLKEVLREGPVIASVRYKFEPQNPIPHLAVINGIDGELIYYNDPAAAAAGQAISVQDFMKAWKKRFIVVRP